MLALISACTKETEKTVIPNKGMAIPVTVLELQKNSFSSPISGSGNTTTNNETLLSFKQGGIIDQIFVQEGDPVKKGQLLARLNLTEIQTGLNQAKIGLEKANRDFERVQRLYLDSVATLEQFQNSQTALQIAKEQFKAAEFNLTYSQIKANQNGFVLRKFANPGQQIASGAPVLQINGAKDGKWLFKATVNDQNWAKIELGDLAKVFLEGDNSQGIEGKVARKSMASDPITGAWWVEIELNEKNPSLASGLFGRAEIYPSAQTDGWELPYEALLDAQGDTGFVFVVKNDSLAQKIPVKLGKLSAKNIQVTAGLEGYSHLIVTGSAYLTDGSIIQVNRP